MLTLIVIAVLLLDVLYLVSTFTKSKDEAAAEPEAIAIGADLSAVNRLAWDYQGTDYALTYDGGAWRLDADADFPVNQTMVAAMTTALGNLSATQQIDKVSDFDQYGLTAPTLTVQAGDVAYLVGSFSTLNNSYYLRIGEDATVYLIDGTLTDAFSHNDSDLLKMETISGFGTTSRLAFTGAADSFELTLGSDGAWQLAAQPDAVLDQDAVKALVTQVTGCTWLTCVSYKDSDMAAYGLREPSARVSISDDVGKTFTFLFGDDAADGTYACFEGSDMVYLVSTDTANAMRGATAAALLAK